MTTIKTGTSLIATAAILTACALLVLSDRPAFAEDQASHTAQSFAFDFEYGPDELQSAEQANALLGRLQHRIRRQCKSESRMSLSERKLTRKCVDATMATAVRNIGSTTLATIYENRTDG